jgi:hypothetical protein
MEYDQRMIIKFLLNEGADARDIADRLETDCMHNLVNIFITRMHERCTLRKL